MVISDVSFVGLAVLYGLLGSLAVLAGAWALGRFPGWRALPLLWATLGFVALTQHPFPNPATLSCPVATAAPQLAPAQVLDTIAQLNRHGAGLLDYATNRVIVATAMNFLLCVLIGLALARHVTRWRGALLFGAVLTLTIETTQLTGFWGLWPCAWRQFNVDDLMMNLLGVAAGFALMRRTSPKSAPDKPA